MRGRMSFGAWPVTPAVKRFLIVNGAVWLVLVISVNWMDALALHDHLALTPERVYPGLELWQPFTYMWLHSTADFSHILFNSLFLWMFGGSAGTSVGHEGVHQVLSDLRDRSRVRRLRDRLHISS